MAKFFIDRPIFAWVIAILIMMGGALALSSLPVAQYPDIASPEIAVTAMYPGASAKTVENTVTQVIEQQMKGIDNLLYMASSSDSAGRTEITFTFEAGTNVDIAQVQVQNKLQLATPLLPEMVQRQGITVAKSTKNFLIIINFISEDGSMDSVDIADYVASYIQEPLGRLPGVGDSQLYGAQYAIRVWLDPEKMDQYRLNPTDIIAVIQEQNDQVTGGQIGADPAPPGQQINFTVNASSRLESVEEFENILVRVGEDGSLLYLKDIARIELNNENFMAKSRYNGMPSAGMSIKLASGANALDTIQGIKDELDSLSAYYPAGLKHMYSLDSAPTISTSIKAVFKTLLEAVILVFIIMYVFLQSFRATVIPTIAVPVVLLGTFAVLYLAGYSINTLTMFGMVLAIGLLVDDAIVVVENVERLKHEEGLNSRDAARKSMDQITGALIGVAMVISAVFVPMAFMGGSTGVIFRQFSITIVTAMTLSVVVAIVLTPALCATMLPSHHQMAERGLLGAFNRWFERITKRYQAGVAHMLQKPQRYFGLFGLGIVAIVFMFWRIPSAFLPNEDQGLFFTIVELPAGGTFERTEKVLEEIESFLLTEEKDSIQSVMTVSGVSMAGFGQNAGMAIVSLKDWSERGSGQSVFDVVNRTRARFADTPEAQVISFAPPAVLELGNANGFDFQLMDRAGLGHDALMEARNILLQKANAHPDLVAVRHMGLDDTEQYALDIDTAKAGALSLSKGVINSAISAYWGSAYVNDFTDRGRTKKVYVQADPDYRMQPSDFDRYRVRNTKGEMVPFSSFLSMHSEYGSPRLERYLGVPSLNINGEAAPGRSTGQAMAAMEAIAEELPQGIGYAWTGISFQERLSGNQAPMLYAISMAVVFLCLAALYESWTIPLSVMLAVPTGVVGALAGVMLRGMSNDIYFQIGLLTIIGLSAKNSILIVEFARDLHDGGKSLFEATVTAVRMRLRPIVMTSLCFILGVIPLAVSSGAGSGGQNALGTTVMAGMLAATALGIFFTPLFFVAVTRLFSRNNTRNQQG